MGLKCSLLGHAFGEPTVEREREERGSEVVTVVREIEECDRCGERRVVSENKEVTSVVEPEEVGLDEGGAGAGSFNDDEFEPPESVEDEDAEIIEDSGDDRAPGEWPEEPGGRSDRGGGTTSTADESPDAPEADDDGDEEAGASFDDEAEIVEGGRSESTGASGGTATGGADRATDTVEAREVEGEADLETGADADEGPETLVCPECEWSVSADSSFIEGDACPECQRGYLRAR